MFPKSKKTFLMKAGRLGAPSSRKPMGKGGVDVKSAKKPKAKVRPHKTKSFKMKKPVTGAMKGVLPSFKTAVAPPMPARGKYDLANGGFKMSKRTKGSNPKQDALDKRLGAYFSSVKPGY